MRPVTAFSAKNQNYREMKPPAEPVAKDFLRNREPSYIDRVYEVCRMKSTLENDNLQDLP